MRIKPEETQRLIDSIYCEYYSVTHNKIDVLALHDIVSLAIDHAGSIDRLVYLSKVPERLIKLWLLYRKTRPRKWEIKKLIESFRQHGYVIPEMEKKEDA